MSYTYKVKLERSDGKAFVITYDGLKDNLGINQLDEREEHRFNVLWERLNELDKEVEKLYLPQMEKRIVDFVKANPNCKTRDFTIHIWRKLHSRAERGAYDTAFKNLETSNVIVPTSQGGRDRTWRVVDGS